MLVGDPAVFAIESGITKAYKRLGFRALGYFLIYIGGICYGRRSPDSTMLACSFDEVGRRLHSRGRHVAPFASEKAGAIASAFRNAVYEEEQMESYFGIALPVFKEMMYSKEIVWAPDGDEAFDDGSYVLQFDLHDRVRLIGFKSTKSGSYDSATLRDVYLSTNEFYACLRNWKDAFEHEWASLPKHD